MTKTWRRMLGICTTMAAVTALTFEAHAQTGCQVPAGPDVIVGDLSGPSNYASTGGTLEALSLGTTSCNVGQFWLNWFQNTNQHPVIGGGLYRFKTVNGANRFEQVGISWLKHGFFALSNTLCCSGCQSTDGTHLGVACSDPYTSSRNGDNTGSGLGPRYQVNAHTGVFTYPHVNCGSAGNNGRIEVLTSDLAVTSGNTTRYFGESQYVTPDDATAGNQNNNASSREVSVSGSGSAWTFGFIGSTQREKQAVRMWASIDANVHQNDVQIAGDGLMILSYATTDLGGGQWHYEYALYNMNADVAGSSFSVPVPAGVTLTNIGFHDIVYRYGDGVSNVTQDGTDWPDSEPGGAITWATTQTFAQNQNANAIRWGSTYNFRFDANAAPTPGTATIGLFKNGSSVTSNVDVPGANLGAPGTAMCFGDDSDPFETFCPCGNPGVVGHGCANSVNANGGLLTAIGFTNPDSVVLQASGMPSVASIAAVFLQGDALVAPALIFGDGLRCAGGNLIRLGSKPMPTGSAQYPETGNLSVSTKGGVTPGSGVTRYYQTYYRNSSVSFCPPETFNVTNGMQIVW